MSKDVNVKMAYLGEIRDNLFSSDHFPLLAILNISKPEG